MHQIQSLFRKVSNCLFAIPAIAQLWAEGQARKTKSAGADNEGIPFTQFTRPLHACRAVLITTGGIHLSSQQPFDMQNPNGDATYREIPGDVEVDMLTITHNYYDHTDADQDINVILPLAHFQHLVDTGVIGSLASQHFGLMGHIDGDEVDILVNHTGPEIAAKLHAGNVDFAFLTPA